MKTLNYSSRALTQSELDVAGGFFHASRERFFGGGAWLTPEFVQNMLHRCIEGGAVLGLFAPSPLGKLRGLVGYWIEVSEAPEAQVSTAFVPFALNSGSHETLAFLAGLDALSHHLIQREIPRIAFVAAEDDGPRRRLYARFADETGREEKRGFQVVRYEANASRLHTLAQRYVGRSRILTAA